MNNDPTKVVFEPALTAAEMAQASDDYEHELAVTVPLADAERLAELLDLPGLDGEMEAATFLKRVALSGIEEAADDSDVIRLGILAAHCVRSGRGHPGLARPPPLPAPAGGGAPPPSPQAHAGLASKRLPTRPPTVAEPTPPRVETGLSSNPSETYTHYNRVGHPKPPPRR
jgi:hypothetical protein